MGLNPDLELDSTEHVYNGDNLDGRYYQGNFSPVPAVDEEEGYRKVISNPTRPSLPVREAESYRTWSPMGRDETYRDRAENIMSSKKRGPGGSMGKNTQ